MKSKHKKLKTNASNKDSSNKVTLTLSSGRQYERSADYVHHYDSDGEDNRAVDEINRNKVSTDSLHIEFKRLKWTNEDRDMAKQMGLPFKKGKFTKEEDLILVRNWRQFCDDFPVYKPHLVLGYFGYNEDIKNSIERKEAKDMIKRSEMYLRLALDLPQRPLSQIYQRARKLFSGLNKSQNLTDDDRQRIIELGLKGYKSREIAPNFLADIKTVDEVLRRNINRKNKTLFKKDKWSAYEDNKFNEIVQDIITKKQISDPSDIPWADVALLMGDRNDHQCREHFYSVSFFKVYDSNSTLKTWDFCESQKLTYFLWKKNYETEDDIDWDEIKEKFSDILFNQLMKSWRRMKNRIDDCHELKFPELIHRLYFKYIETRSNVEELEEFCRSDPIY